MNVTTTASGLDVGLVLRALSRAPSVHGTQPWLAEPHPDGVDLLERFDITLPLHDPDGRDRALSCGAALTTMAVAIRAQGRNARITLLPDRDRPELAGRVSASEIRPATAADLASNAAVCRRRSCRAPFSLRGVSWPDRDALTIALGDKDIRSRVVRRGDCAVLADLLGYAGTAYREDHAYQRELTAWLPEFPEPLPAVSTLPWSGLVRADTRLPDRYTLAERLGRECLVLVLARNDTRRDHLRAGAALQRAWLVAVARGLVASVVTQPWHLPEVRTALVDHLDLDGVPLAMLRVGHPVRTTGTPLPAEHRL